METNRAQWLTNQYPENWSANVAAEALCKILEGKVKPLATERSSSTQSPKDMKLQYRRNQGQYIGNQRILFIIAEVSIY